MSYRKLQRTKSQRKALLRDLTTSLILNGRIETSAAKAKEVRKQAEKMITLGKKNDLNSRRKANTILRNVIDVNSAANSEEENVEILTVLQKLFNEVAPRFKDRNGGYTRIIKTRQRRGDAAEMAVIELTEQ